MTVKSSRKLKKAGERPVKKKKIGSARLSKCGYYGNGNDVEKQ